LRALLDAVRLGDTRAADGIERLGVHCVVGEMALTYARALTAGDATALADVAADFDGIGMRGVGADATKQAEAARG
jgi:hypothetical protein